MLRNAIESSLAVVGLVICAAVLTSTPVIAQEMTVIRLPCQGGYPVWLWVDGTEGGCVDIGGGLVACENPAGTNVAQGTCSLGCTEVRIGSIAGCYRGDGPPDIYTPNFTLLCPDKKIDLKGVEGDTCKYDEHDQAGNPTGAKCSQTKDGEEKISAQANCKTGCVVDRPPGQCTVR